MSATAAALCLGYAEATLLGLPFVEAMPEATSEDLLVFLRFRIDYGRLMSAHYHVAHCPCGRLVVS